MSKDAPSKATTREERQRGERFLAAYHSIEQVLRMMTGDSSSKEGFRHLVDDLSKENAVVRRFRDDLSEFGELRNAIIHERISPDYLIAVPLEDTVSRIEEIARLVTDPPVVYPMFRRDVAVFSPDDTMSDVFRAMRSTGYTQFPVYDSGTYRGLLTDGGIASWVARVVGAEGTSTASLGHVPVDEVLANEKNPDRARFVSKNAAIYEVAEVFKENSRQDKWRVSAVLITESGSPRDKLLGIVTPSDILSLTTV